MLKQRSPHQQLLPIIIPRINHLRIRLRQVLIRKQRIPPQPIRTRLHLSHTQQILIRTPKLKLPTHHATIKLHPRLKIKRMPIQIRPTRQPIISHPTPYTRPIPPHPLQIHIHPLTHLIPSPFPLNFPSFYPSSPQIHPFPPFIDKDHLQTAQTMTIGVNTNGNFCYTAPSFFNFPELK